MNFNSIVTKSFTAAASSVANSSNYLRPFGVYQAKFDGSAFEEVTSKDGRKFKTLNLSFSCPEGNYRDTYFLPEETSESLQRSTGSFGEQPSRAEHFIAYVCHVFQALKPEALAKFQEVVGKLGTFEEIAKVVAKALDTVKGKEVTLRLIGRKYSRPDGTFGWSATANHFLAAISRDGDFYVQSKRGFLNNPAPWTAREEQDRAEYLSAKPTAMTDNGPAADSLSAPVAPTNAASPEEISDILGML